MARVGEQRQQTPASRAVPRAYASRVFSGGGKELGENERGYTARVPKNKIKIAETGWPSRSKPCEGPPILVAQKLVLNENSERILRLWANRRLEEDRGV